MKTLKKLQALLLAAAFFLSVLSGCSSGEAAPTGGGSGDAPGESSDVSAPASGGEGAAGSGIGTPENDTGVGLKNIKIDTTDRELTDEQKAVISYFDNDYLYVGDYEFLRRYPNIFQNAQIELYGMVVKVLSMDNNNYKIVIWLNMDPAYAPYYTPGEYIILNGKTNPASWFMEDDCLYANGRYTGIETVDIDGTSYTIPTMDVYNAGYSSGRHQFNMAQRSDYSTIKVVAQAIFGKDIEIRDPVAGEDLSMEEAMIDYYAFGGMPYEGMDPSEITEYWDLLVELEDQSNANFKKFRFSKYEGRIIDAKGPFDTGIQRRIEFSADFEHFFLFTHNESLESLKLAYYDKQFNKIWEREFEETTNAIYDYTENNLYIVVNNELYIINIQTGEDTFAPAYVGEKLDIRKFSDGIVMVSASKSDGVMKVALDGRIIWKTNLSSDPTSASGLQLVDGNLIVSYGDEDWNSHCCLIDSGTGELLIDATVTF